MRRYRNNSQSILTIKYLFEQICFELSMQNFVYVLVFDAVLNVHMQNWTLIRPQISYQFYPVMSSMNSSPFISGFSIAKSLRSYIIHLTLKQSDHYGDGTW